MTILASDARIRLLMTGSPYFNEQMRAIALPDDRWDVTAVDFSCTMPYRPQLIARFSRLLMQSDVWYKCGGIYSMKHVLALQLARFLGASTVVHWIGGDVLYLRTALARRYISLPTLQRFHNWATAPWLVEELGRLGIRATFVPFTSLKRKAYLAMTPPAFPRRFTVVTSLHDRRSDFYGFDHIVRLAREFPEITVNVLQARSAPVECPPNVHLLGWVADTLEVYRNCTVAARLTRHDGYSGSIQEPLALGRHAIWSYPFPGALQATDYATLRGHVAALLELHRSDALELNYEGRQFIAQQLDPDTLATNFAEALSGCAQRTPGTAHAPARRGPAATLTHMDR